MDVKSVLLGGFSLPDVPSITILGAVLVHCVVATLVLPGPSIKGAKLKNDKQLTYKLNGSYVHLSAILLYVIGSFILKLFPASIVYDHYGPLLTTTLLFSAALTLFLYLRSLVWIPKNDQNFHYSKSNVIMNLWVGTELNPHFFGFEVKLFSYRPGFVLLSLINVSCLAVQLERYSTVSTPMLIFQAISLWYAVDCFIFENGTVFMFDVIEENFGFMLVFGDYTWIPFVFSLQAVYLIENSTVQGWYAILTFVVFFIGYYIFRESNYQKFQFRQDPSVIIWGKPARTLDTKSGRKLLVSGWWGIARKVNYLGDILIAISMSMPCGFGYAMPWLYPIYLTCLLINRAQRDNDRCKIKYGEDWDKYCKEVPSTIVPYVY